MSTSLLALWRKRIEDQKSSGMSTKNWCIKNQLTLHKYYYWKKRVTESRESPVPPIFVAVTNTKLNKQMHLGLRVSLGNVELTVASANEVHLAAMLLNQLQQTC